MRKILLAGAVLAAIASPALAADMALKAPVAPAVAIYSWTGFYVGGHVGWAWSDWTSYANPLPSQAAFTVANETFNESRSGAVAGVHAGYNYQFQSSLVAGIEADISWSGLRQSSTHQLRDFPALTLCPTCFGTMSRDVNWLSSVRGRLGFAANNLLLYVTGGAAWGDVSYTSLIRTGGLYNNPASTQSTEFGWVAGAGLEYAFAQNWILRGEYLYYRLGNGANRTTFDTVNFPTTFPYNTAWSETKINVARVGLSYKFGGPVVAKY